MFMYDGPTGDILMPMGLISLSMGPSIVPFGSPIGLECMTMGLYHCPWAYQHLFMIISWDIYMSQD
jgi:hypothetical protein